MKHAALLSTALMLVLGIAFHVPVNAQSQSVAASVASTDALGEIAQALGRIADMLDRQAQGSRLDLLMKRVDASNRRLGQLEGRLRTTQHDYAQARENLTRMETQLQNLDERAAAEDADSVQLRFSRVHIETEIELGRQQISTLGMSKAQLENEIASRSRDVEDWQAYVDRELSGLE